jgi:hypothetical protein
LTGPREDITEDCENRERTNEGYEGATFVVLIPEIYSPRKTPKRETVFEETKFENVLGKELNKLET